MGTSWAGTLAFVALFLGALPAPAQTRESPDTSHFELGIHGRSTRASARSEQAAWLTLTVPFDALAQPRLAQAPAAPSPPTTAEPPVLPPPLALNQLKALVTFARKVKAVALGVASSATERQRLDSLATRSRASALLPELRLRAQRNTDQALRWAPTNDDPYRVTQADGAGTTLEISLSFQLDRLIFSRDELGIERLRADAASERTKLEARVLTSLSALLRARELGCVAGLEEEVRAEQLMRLVEQFAALDDLTAGWFSEQASSFSNAIWGFPEAIAGACAPPGPAAASAVTKAVASLTDSE